MRDQDLSPEEQAQAAADIAAENARRTAVEDIQWVMSSPRGRRIVWGMLEDAGVFKTSFTGDVNWSIFREGARNQGLKLLAFVQDNCPGYYEKMLAERKGK